MATLSEKTLKSLLEDPLIAEISREVYHMRLFSRGLSGMPVEYRNRIPCEENCKTADEKGIGQESVKC